MCVDVDLSQPFSFSLDTSIGEKDMRAWSVPKGREIVAPLCGKEGTPPQDSSSRFVCGDRRQGLVGSVRKTTVCVCGEKEWARALEQSRAFDRAPRIRKVLSLRVL